MTVTAVEFARIVVAVYLGLFVLGLAATAVWAAWLTAPTPETTWTGHVLIRAGRILVAVGLVGIDGVILAAVVAGVLVIFRS